MSLAAGIFENYKILSIVGMAKNAGKTTALNYILEEAMEAGLVVAVTSTGRDGESVDLVTGTEKPKVFLEEGMLVTVPEKLYELCDAGLEIIKMTHYSTPLGAVMICRVAESGYVQVAGPVTTAEQKKLCQEFLAMSVDMVIIDGAIDRKSVAEPETSDAIILSTGAVLSRNAKKVAEETAHIVGLYGLEILPDSKFKSLLEESMDDKNQNRVILGERDRLWPLELKTGLGAGRYIDEAITEKVEYVYIPGALTKSIVEDIGSEKLKKVIFVLKDPTKIFIEALDWQKLRKKGFEVKVLENIKVAAITVNPYSPEGYSFPREALIEAVSSVVKGIPVLDVKYTKTTD